MRDDQGSRDSQREHVADDGLGLRPARLVGLVEIRAAFPKELEGLAVLARCIALVEGPVRRG